MFNQRSSERSVVIWKVVVIPEHEPDRNIHGTVKEVSQKGLCLFCDAQLLPHNTYRLMLQIPDPTYTQITYAEVLGKPIYSSLAGMTGQFRTGMRLTTISPDYRKRIEQLQRKGG